MFPVTSKGAARVAGYVPLAHRNLHEQDAQTYYTLAEASNGSVVRLYRLPLSRITKLIPCRRL